MFSESNYIELNDFETISIENGAKAVVVAECVKRHGCRCWLRAYFVVIY